MSTPRRILLADADAFFVAVARMVDPEGAGRAPLLIVGGKPGSRGVVCSASYETRAYGVRSAMPIAHALRLCPDALCVPVPRGACTATSRAIGAVLHRFTPVVQAASIDEWYLDLSGTETLYAPETFEQTARRIRETVYRETGIHLSFGGGTSKFVAKLAAERAKPRADVGGDGVRIIAPGDEGTFLREFTLGDLPGVGPKLKAKLATLARWIGRRPAEWLWARVRGIHDAPVEGRAPAKQVSRETTFREDLAETAAIAGQLRSLVATVASELRRDRTSARTVTVKLKDRDFTTRLASRTVPEPLESDRAIGEIAVALLTRLRSARRVPARLVGVAVSGLAPARDAEQLALFGGAPAVERPEDRAVSRAVDRVRERFGSAAIAFGVDGTPAPRAR